MGDRGVDLGALGGTRTPNLLIRRYLYRRPDPFKTGRHLGLVSRGCPAGSGSSQGCSSVWLPAWLPPARPWARLMVFKSIRDSGLTVVATCAFITSACFVTQDHPVYIPQLLSAVTRRAGGR
jgi:hypothetical protein